MNIILHLSQAVRTSFYGTVASAAVFGGMATGLALMCGVALHDGNTSATRWLGAATLLVVVLGAWATTRFYYTSQVRASVDQFIMQTLKPDSLRRPKISSPWAGTLLLGCCLGAGALAFAHHLLSMTLLPFAGLAAEVAIVALVVAEHKRRQTLQRYMATLEARVATAEAADFQQRID